ncbi:hypothetical protein GCM10010266_50290 [Streptomyces griseomycini]|nr:hypothetical protein GCM10010266_50290 [Streptomyces griseomycini]
MDRRIPFDAPHDFRDLGGRPTADGRRVRPGLLHRSDSLGKLSTDTADWTRFLSPGIRTVVDLRHPWETGARGPVPEHPSFAYHNLSSEHRPYDPAALAAGVAPGPYLAERHTEVAEDGAKEIAAALRLVADAARAAPPWSSTAPRARTARACRPPWSWACWASPARRSSRTSPSPTGPPRPSWPSGRPAATAAPRPGRPPAVPRRR